MTWSATIFRGALAALAAMLLSGCAPSAQSQSDEEKEPHFMAGKKRVSTLDYSGAIESFERALEINPRSAAAHFELACLFDQRETDPAAAIYHYQSYLRLRPEAGNADVVKQRMTTCKQALARDVSLGPLTQRQQQELEQVLEENRRLNGQVKQLNDELDKWRVYAAHLAGITNQPPAAPRPRGPASSLGGSSSPTPGSTSNSMETPAPSGKTHTVKAGETATVIARRYGIKVEVLLAANPRAEPRRLQVGQVLVIPVP